MTVPAELPAAPAFELHLWNLSGAPVFLGGGVAQVFFLQIPIDVLRGFR
jgi:hypothetical protein